MDAKLEILKKTALFGGLSTQALEVLGSKMIERRLDRNAILFTAGEPANARTAEDRSPPPSAHPRLAGNES